MRRRRGIRGDAALQRFVAGVAAWALVAGAGAAHAQPAHAQQERSSEDLLDLAAGTLVLSYSGQYSQEWGSMQLLDGTTSYGWSSPTGEPFPHQFVLELPRRYRLERLVLSNQGAQESGYPGISARNVDVSVAVAAPDGPFEQVKTVEVPPGGRAETTLPEGTEARWLKLVIRDNWGHEEYTELMELEGYGEPAGERLDLPPVTGVYDTNYGLLKIVRDGSRVAGCYDWGDGQIEGSTDGRVVRFEWIQADGEERGTALMVLASDGRYLNGFWYEYGNWQGMWYGEKTEGEETECTVPTARDDLEEKLTRGDRAILYGVYFEFDSARLQERSRQTLEKVLAVLQGRPDLRLRVVGHTDAVGDEAYNERLSLERAEAVRQWLVEEGVDPARLESEGRGEAEPVADNDTPQGRALNRRVEIVAITAAGGSP